MHIEFYKGYKITLKNSNGVMVALIKNKVGGLHGAGVSEDIHTAINKAKAKIDKLPPLKAKLSY